MTTDEMSDLFSELSNTYQRGTEYGKEDFLSFDEYEKSMYLTLAQQIYVIACYSGRNESGYQFEVTEEDRRALDSLMTTIHPIAVDADQMTGDHIVPDSKFYRLPPSLMFIVYEQVKWSSDNGCYSGKSAVVVPTTHDEFWKTYRNPFRKQSKRRVLRLDVRNNIVELVADGTIQDYLVRFLRKPNPIILVDLPSDSDLSIFDGNTSERTCELDSSIQPKIVEIAVNLALQRKSIGNTK